MTNFLPINKEDLDNRNWSKLDFVLITGDAYVDHPSFGTAIISRMLEKRGYKVGIIPQPDWRNIDDFKKLGRPRLAFLITSGNIDSMVNHYSVSKTKRKRDVYSPGGKAGLRPDRAVIVYANKVREAYKDIPIILGGVEASLRRFSHYDYWDDKVRKPIIFDSKADMIIYGMGEKSIIEVAESLDAGILIKDITYIKGTSIIDSSIDNYYDYLLLPSYEEIIRNKKEFARAALIQFEEQDAFSGKILIQKIDNRYLVQNPPQVPLSQSEMDEIYDLPYVRQYHPIYEDYNGVPALDEVKFSITSQRGCFGSCNFCALALHQGKIIQNRSKESIVDEAKRLTELQDFKGYIHDVGGPTANFREPACKKQNKYGSCKDKRCLFPKACSNLEVNHSELLNILKTIREIPKVKKVFIRSGIRFDYLLLDKEKDFIYDLINYHISGQLKIAPEHISDKVLNKMGKPKSKVYLDFVDYYQRINKKLGKSQYLVPYFMSSHPGSTLKDAIALAEYIRDLGHIPEQVQDFYPTPGSISTAMYYTEIDPYTMNSVYVAKSPKEKAMQRALIQYNNPKNYNLVYEALQIAKREDLIGHEQKCLIKLRGKKDSSNQSYNRSKHKGGRRHVTKGKNR